MSHAWKTFLIRVCLTLFWGSVIVGLTLTYATESPFWETSKHRQNAIRMAPQGWEFFTRNPREPTNQVYVQRDGQWTLDDRFYAGSRSLKMLVQRNRLVDVELAHLLAQVKDSTWTECEEGLRACTEAGRFERVAVANESNLRNVCGSFLIERQRPTPWAWTADSDDLYMPAKLVAIDVDCRRKSDDAPATADATP